MAKIYEIPYEGVSKLVQQTGVDPRVLDRMLKIAEVSMNPGTASEGENAARALDSLLHKYNIERAAVLALAKQGDVMTEAGRFCVVMPFKRRVHSHFQLARGVCSLFNAAWYHSHGHGHPVRFVFVGSSALAHGAARLFADLYAKSVDLSRRVQKKKAFLEGMADGFYGLAQEVRTKRQKYYDRIREEAAVREQMRTSAVTAEVAIAAVQQETDRARAVKTEEVQALLQGIDATGGSPQSIGAGGGPSQAIGANDGPALGIGAGGGPSLAFAASGGPTLEFGAEASMSDDSSSDDDVEEVVNVQPPAPVVDLTGPDADALSVMQNERDDAVRSAAEAAIVYSKKRSRALLGYTDRDSEAYRAGKRAASDLPTSTAIGN